MEAPEVFWKAPIPGPCWAFVELSIMKQLGQLGTVEYRPLLPDTGHSATTHYWHISLAWSTIPRPALLAPIRLC